MILEKCKHQLLFVCTDVQLSNCSVLGVRLLDAFHSCYSCSGKVSCTSKSGECTRCSTAQLIDKCDLRYTARLDVRSEGNIKTVTAFSPVVEKKCADTTVSKGKLLCEQFTLTVSESNVNHIIICFIFHVTYEY